MRGRERVSEAVTRGRPYVETVAKDEQFREHVKEAYDSARRVYDELFGTRSPAGVAMRAATDAGIQDELKRTVQELREAGRRLQKTEESHTGRNVTLLLVGLALGALLNPVTGPETRRWLKDKVFGAEESFDTYEPTAPS